MLEPKLFAKTIQKLSEYYPKFELTKEQMTTWYKFFRDYSYEEFMYVVKTYIGENSYQPQSPAHLLNGNHARVILPPKWLMAETIGQQLPQPEGNQDEVKQLLQSFKEDK